MARVVARRAPAPDAPPARGCGGRVQGCLDPAPDVGRHRAGVVGQQQAAHVLRVGEQGGAALAVDDVGLDGPGLVEWQDVGREVGEQVVVRMSSRHGHALLPRPGTVVDLLRRRVPRPEVPLVRRADPRAGSRRPAPVAARGPLRGRSGPARPGRASSGTSPCPRRRRARPRPRRPRGPACRPGRSRPAAPRGAGRVRPGRRGGSRSRRGRRGGAGPRCRRAGRSGRASRRRIRSRQALTTTRCSQVVTAASPR